MVKLGVPEEWVFLASHLTPVMLSCGKTIIQSYWFGERSSIIPDSLCNHYIFHHGDPSIPLFRQFWSKILALIALVWTDFTVDQWILGCGLYLDWTDWDKACIWIELDQMATIPIKTGMLIVHTLNNGNYITEMEHVESRTGVLSDELKTIKVSLINIYVMKLDNIMTDTTGWHSTHCQVG